MTNFLHSKKEYVFCFEIYKSHYQKIELRYFKLILLIPYFSGKKIDLLIDEKMFITSKIQHYLRKLKFLNHLSKLAFTSLELE